MPGLYKISIWIHRNIHMYAFYYDANHLRSSDNFAIGMFISYFQEKNTVMCK